MKAKSVLFFTLVLILFFSTMGCKKETKSFADELAGTYIAYDTVIISAGFGCGTNTYKTYSIVVSKESDNSINFSELKGCTNEKANITGTNITLINTSCSTEVNPSITRNGSTLYFTSFENLTMSGCTATGNIKAVKQ